ncbi:hypothetical protein F2Q68_00032912 [Brassica cretica]|uniref:Uncharacterized protein n=1 Tax=Brassica cretica TaxID=69181 RepID=A0A8S9GFA2_BRACR|nr:hypothetical protein F2Q68_00032914 [Brassica cretica]KAF2544213.1 hypothetical protein F2Q68_00032912 [Brassica cretica]
MSHGLCNSSHRSQTKLSIFSQSSAISSLITSGPLQSSSFWSPSPFETVTRHHHHRSSPPSPSDTTIAVRHYHHRSSPPLPSDTIDLYLSLILFQRIKGWRKQSKLGESEQGCGEHMIRGVGEDIATASKMVKKIWRKLKSQSERRRR